MNPLKDNTSIDYLRSSDTLMKDCLLPNPFSLNKREGAVTKVLRLMPEDDYNWFVNEGIDIFEYFIPDVGLLGMVRDFIVERNPDPKCKEYARMLYLSPALERCAIDIVVAVTAHELAHIRLCHETIVINNEIYIKQEKEAWEMACSWGLEKEVKKHQAVQKRMRTILEKGA